MKKDTICFTTIKEAKKRKRRSNEYTVAINELDEFPEGQAWMYLDGIFKNISEKDKIKCIFFLSEQSDRSVLKKFHEVYWAAAENKASVVTRHFENIKNYGEFIWGNIRTYYYKVGR